jgi:hypothetical protein
LGVAPALLLKRIAFLHLTLEEDFPLQFGVYNIYIYVYSIYQGYSLIRGSLLGEGDFTTTYDYVSVVYPHDIDDIIPIHPYCNIINLIWIVYG